MPVDALFVIVIQRHFSNSGFDNDLSPGIAGDLIDVFLYFFVLASGGAPPPKPSVLASLGDPRSDYERAYASIMAGDYDKPWMMKRRKAG